MQISTCQLNNYKSFKASDELKFTPGFNVIVGRNNVGKSALIEALSARLSSIPHRSLDTVKKADSPINPQSTATLTFVVEPEECVSILAKAGEFHIPNIGNQTVQQTADQFLNYVTHQIPFRCTFANGNIPNAELVGFGNGYGKTNTNIKFRYDLNADQFELTNNQLVGVGNERTFAHHLATGLRDRIYVFHAERLNVGQCRIGTNAVLHPNAQNLAEVLQLLQSNVARFARFNKDLSTVFPEIQQITVRPVDKENVRILVWSVDPNTEREDLAVPLTDCGTGIGQVLAVLYVVTNSDSPRTIIIDEPQSFLHPGAIRKLFDIFKRYPQHQFIISTHSPAAVTAANPKTLILLRREGNESKSEVLNVNETGELRFFLSEIGARLSDVFGADNILWVEGRTEEVCFRLIVEQVLKQELLGTEIIGVKHTGDFQGRNAKAVPEIYERLSKGRGLLPPALAFAFDREGHTNKSMQEMEQTCRGLHFLPRTMYENYLLNPAAIAAVLSEADAGRPAAVTEQEINDWLKGLKSRKLGYSAGSDDWIKKVDAARMLDEMFSDLSSTRVCYDKVKHGVKLTEWIIKNSPTDFAELAAFLGPLLKKQR